jgi:hypothetical protein
MRLLSFARMAQSHLGRGCQSLVESHTPKTYYPKLSSSNTSSHEGEIILICSWRCSCRGVSGDRRPAGTGYCDCCRDSLARFENPQTTRTEEDLDLGHRTTTTRRDDRKNVVSESSISSKPQVQDRDDQAGLPGFTKDFTNRNRRCI